MSDSVFILLAGIFLPLFPMSMVFNALVDNIKHTLLRAFIYLAWPLCGLVIVLNVEMTMPDWLLPLALATSALYALRMLTLREVNQWSGFLATSLWSLLWIAVMQDTPSVLLYSYALSMSLPMVLLVLLCAGLEHRFGAAYTGLYGGLARTIPRFAGILVTVVVAATATPLFPTFFIILEMIVKAVSVTPTVAIVLLIIWLLWSWSGARLIQGLIVGRASDVRIADMDVTTSSLYMFVLLSLIIVGVYLGGLIL